MNISATQALQPEARAPVVVVDPHLNFTRLTWNTSQLVEVLPGEDPVLVPLPFQLLLVLSSSLDPGFVKRRVVQGLRTDEGSPAGVTPQEAIVIYGDPDGIQVREAAVLQAASAAFWGGQGSTGMGGSERDRNATAVVELGQPLQAPATLGSVAFYNLTTAQTVHLNIAACSADAALQVVVYNASIATW